MIYSVNGYNVKAYNAAKPQSTASKYIIKFLEKYLDPTQSVLDYGCGKLRYSIPVSNKVRMVVATDSHYQLNRQIKINGIKTTVSDDSKKYGNIETIDLDQIKRRNYKYDLILLIHVLSSIPDDVDRQNVTNHIVDLCTENTKIICCNNHRMSYFKKWEKSNKVIKYNDGYLVTEPNTAYFGIIDKVKILNYFPKEKFIHESTEIIEDNTVSTFTKKAI